MELELAGKNVLITGGGRGIGRTMALTYAAEGARVAVNDISAEAIAEVVSEIEQAGGTAFPAKFDVTDLIDVREAVTRLEEKMGGLDVLVNNAALIVAHELFLDVDPQDCEKEIDVIFRGTTNCCRAVVPGMIKRRYGKVVNIATDSARVGQERQCNYSSAKGAVISFTKSFAKEVGRHNVNVNAVSPGATNSPIRAEMLRQLIANVGKQKAAEREEKIKRAYALKRIGDPEDVANAVVFLTSERARHITGQILSVNGGYAMPG